MLTRLGRTLYRRRWSVLVCIIVLTALMGWYGSSVFDALGGTGVDNQQSESIRASHLLDTTFTNNASDTSIVILLSSPTLKATDPQFEQAASRLITTLKGRREVSSLQSYYGTKDSSFVSRDGHETFIVAVLKSEDSYKTVQPLLVASPLQVTVGGSIVADQQFNAQLEHDLEFGEEVSLPIVLLLLVLVFGGVVAAILPLLIGGFAIAGSFAIVHALTTIMSVSSFATNVITFIGLGLAIDYSLFIITRFREEMVVRDGNVQEALARTMATAGRTVFFSGLTVSTSLLSLLLFPESLLYSVGLATIAAALVAMLGALLVLPVILSLLGARVNALSIQRLVRRRMSNAQKQSQGGWYHFSYFVMRWRIPIAVCVILFLLTLGTPFLHVSLAPTSVNSLPTNLSSRIVADQLTQKFPGQDDTSISIAITTHGDALNNDNLALLNGYVKRIQALPEVASVSSLVSVDTQLSLAQYQQLYHPATVPPNAQEQVLEQELGQVAKQLAKGNVTRVDVTAHVDPNSNAAKNLVKQVRALSTPQGFTRLVGGSTAENIDQLASLSAVIPYALVVMAVAIFMLLFLMTGSLVIPIKAIVLNVLSLTATFGAIVWIFQDGHLQNILQFQAYGSIDSTQLILIFAIAFGLSMDYEVFLLSRIKEQFDRTHDNREAVALGLQSTGWLITSAALLLAVVVAAFATSRILELQAIGVGLALAVLMDATLVRTLLVPSMMALLGNWNWWAPRPLRLLWERVGLRESESKDEVQEKELLLQE